MKMTLSLSLYLIIIILFVTTCKKDDTVTVYDSFNSPTNNICQPITNWTDLLRDSQLVTFQLPYILNVDPNYIQWLNNKNNRIDIRSLTSENFSDLQCMKQYIGNRTLVQLGESSHGTKEYSQIKVRLIKFLHEEMGFDVVAFESGFYECFYTNENISQLTSIDALQNSIFGVWETQELLDLFSYIKSTYSTNSPLILAGFDCQFSSKLNSIQQHPSFLYSIITKIDHIFAVKQRIFDSQIIQKILHRDLVYLTQNRDTIINTYYRLLAFIDSHINELNSAYSQEIEIPQILKQSITSILANIDFTITFRLNTQVGSFESMKIRDSAMAANVFFLKEKLYPNKKIMIWAHNYHIANSPYLHALYPDIKVMGNWLHDRYSNELYTIGFYMLRGKTKTEWDWSIINVELPTSESSLEAILYQCRTKYLFVDLLNQNYSNGNKWMYSTITAKTSGFANESMIIRNIYDGIIFIDSSSVPTYLP